MIYAAVTGSAAMLAEGIRSAVDTGNELLLIGERNSAKPAGAKHPFGYRKELHFRARIVALSVFSLGGGLSIHHGIEALRHPESLQDPAWSFVVAGVSALFEGDGWNVSRKALNEARKPGASLWKTVRASKDASVFTVFIEDSAALIGLLLVGESIGPDATRKVREGFEKDPGILSASTLQSMQLGPDEAILTAAVQFKRGMRIEAVMALYPSIRHIYFESGALRSAMG